MPSAPVRVRFAPSPTGYLHVGGARTAIFNWLFARHHGGSFILRIEDTDVERSTVESEVSLLGDLHWLGLDWDEGPDVAGPCGPYRQSERLDLYRARADALFDAGKAYPCFCPDDVLEAKREAAVARGASPRYDGTCRGLTREQIMEMRRAGTPEVTRFIVPPGVVRFHDLIRGEVEMDTEMVGDFVLLRSNGHPTYNYAAAIDDHAMAISHVLRGEEHLPNTLRQLLIYTAFDFPLPKFGHLPLILAEDRSKLSKRHGGASVGELRDLGFLPEAVFNYLVLLGWSHPEEKEVLSREELVAAFSLDRVSKSPSVYDRDKLRWMSGQYIRKTPVEALLEEADPFFPKGIRSLYDKNAREKILSLLHEKIETLADLAEKSAPFEAEPRFEEEATQVLQTRDALGVIAALEERIRSSEGSLAGPEFKKTVEEVGKKMGLKGKALFFPVRAALTGAVHGPDLAGFAELRGREGVLALLDRARKFAAGSES
jgi:nondiscriminating glutamyl-tRNA synthetase